MMRIRPLALGDGSEVLVEVEQVELRLPNGGAGAAEPLGEGALPLRLLRRSIGALAKEVQASLADAAPTEWTMEVSIGFKGEDRPIPVIVTGAATGSVKVIAKWKRED